MNTEQQEGEATMSQRHRDIQEHIPAEEYDNRER
jgi:hypothetical protein